MHLFSMISLVGLTFLTMVSAQFGQSATSSEFYRSSAERFAIDAQRIFEICQAGLFSNVFIGDFRRGPANCVAENQRRIEIYDKRNRGAATKFFTNITTQQSDLLRDQSAYEACLKVYENFDRAQRECGREANVGVTLFSGEVVKYFEGSDAFHFGK